MAVFRGFFLSKFQYCPEIWPHCSLSEKFKNGLHGRSLNGKVAIFLIIRPTDLIASSALNLGLTRILLPAKFSLLNTKFYVEIREGGVFIAVKKHYDMTLLPDLQTNCGCFYRPPDSKISTSEELVKSLDLMPKNQIRPLSWEVISTYLELTGTMG